MPVWIYALAADDGLALPRGVWMGKRISDPDPDPQHNDKNRDQPAVADWPYFFSPPTDAVAHC